MDLKGLSKEQLSEIIKKRIEYLLECQKDKINYMDEEDEDYYYDDSRELIENRIKKLSSGFFWLSLYNVQRFFGGREEGGWWYDSFFPELSFELNINDNLELLYHLIEYIHDRYDIREISELDSVSVPEVNLLVIEHSRAEYYPKEKPRYE